MESLFLSIFLLITLYFIHRGVYTVHIMVKGKTVHMYNTNYQPIIGDVISVDGKKQSYLVKQRVIFKTKDIFERIVVECIDVSHKDESTTETP